MLHRLALLVASRPYCFPETIADVILDAVLHHVAPEEPPAGVLLIPLRLLSFLDRIRRVQVEAVHIASEVLVLDLHISFHDVDGPLPPGLVGKRAG